MERLCLFLSSYKKYDTTTKVVSLDEYNNSSSLDQSFANGRCFYEQGHSIPMDKSYYTNSLVKTSESHKEGTMLLCKRCNRYSAIVQVKQTRSGDEEGTAIIFCIECKY